MVAPRLTRSSALASRRIWITRARPGAEATAAKVAALGWTPVTAPTIERRPLAVEIPDLESVDTLAFTSSAAVAAWCVLTPDRSLPVFTVGDATAERVRAEGFADVVSASGDVAALARTIANAAPARRRVLNPTALEPAADLAARLAPQGVEVLSVAVYETASANLAAAPGDLAAVLVHSAKAAKAAAPLIDQRSARGLVLCAISRQAAGPLTGLAFRRVLIAKTPNEAALLALLGEVEET